jgi:hypothetical protein
MAFFGPLAAAALAAPARADEARRVVFVTDGREGDALARALASRLPVSYVVGDSHGFRAAFSKGGSLGLASALKSHDADSQLVAKAVAAARSARVDLAVLLAVRRTKRERIAHVWVVNPRSDNPLVDEDVAVALSSDTAATAASTWSTIASAFPAEAEQTNPPPESAAPANVPAPAASIDASAPSGAHDENRDASPRAGSDAAPPLFHLGAAVQGGSRHFSYVDRLTPTLRPYDVWLVPMAAVEGELDPFARSDSLWLERLGLAADYARAFGVSSADSAGTHVSASWQTFHIDVRERVPVGATVLVGVHAGYGGNDFSFDGEVDATSHLPSVAYRFVRVGADGQMRLGGFGLVLDASYLSVQSTGAMGELFPRESVGGVEAHVGATRSVTRSLDVIVDLAYTRFFYDYRPEPGDAFVAGGALDQMAYASAGMAYRY